MMIAVIALLLCICNCNAYKLSMKISQPNFLKKVSSTVVASGIFFSSMSGMIGPAVAAVGEVYVHVNERKCVYLCICDIRMYILI
jgi:hypothetical protein